MANVAKPTQKQLRAIGICRQNGCPRFAGRSVEEASDYLSKYIPISKARAQTEREAQCFGVFDGNDVVPDFGYDDEPDGT